MAIDFPNSPTIGDTYTTNGKTYRWDGTVWGVYGTFTVDSTASDTEPTGVANGHIWYRSDQSQTLIRYDGTWVEVGSAGGFDSSSTSFPSSLDSGTGFAAVEALQAKVGADSSAVTSSLDYKVAQLEAGATGGKILQVVSTTKTDVFSTSASALGSEVNITGLSATITPSSTSSKILVMFSINVSQGTDTTAGVGGVLRRDSTDIFVGTDGTSYNTTNYIRYFDNYENMALFVGQHLDSPATTSSVTYQYGIRSVSTGTAYVNRRGNAGTAGLASSITVMEVSA